jgi:hypothetical protein
MSVHWEGIAVGERWYVAQVADNHEVLHIHPIPFPTGREADRGAERLNARPDRSIPR